MTGKDFKGLFMGGVCRVVGVFAGLAVLGGAWATPEEDLTPGPAVGATHDFMTAPEDVVTSANTAFYGEPVMVPRDIPETVSRQPAGAMTGKIVYTSAGHGYTTGNPWIPGRTTHNRVVEDLGNQDQMTLFAYQAFNAGATVVPMRPVGNQVNEVVIDNMDPQVSLTGTWSDSAGGLYYGKPSDAVHYIFTPASTVESAVARYTPNIPQRGFYPVYSWVRDSGNRCTDQLYRIRHTGGVSEVTVDHRRVGKGWVYLGSYYFEAGTDGYCEISNRSNTVGGNVIADAIRFGNGRGDTNRGSGISGLAREDEASWYWIRSMMSHDGDHNVYARTGNDANDNVGAPLRMASYMNNESVGPMRDRVYLSFHSNAGGGRGADGLWNNEAALPGGYAGTRTPNQYELAVFMGREINLDMAAIGSPPLPVAWTSRTRHEFYRTDYAFGEIRWDTVNHEMDATIIETAFHDSALDGPLLRDSRSRMLKGQSSVQGLIRYFRSLDGGAVVMPPDAPVDVKAVGQGDGSVRVSWSRAPLTGWGGSAPTGYVVYSSLNGYGFGNPQRVSGVNSNELVVSGVPSGVPVYFRVAATNAGGESLPSEVLAVRTNGVTSSDVLVVNGFDRLDHFMSPTESAPRVTAHERAKPWRSNSFDYVVQHARALDAAGVNFDSSSNEAVDAGLLAQYGNAVWILGEESTQDDTFDASERTLVTGFLNDGGNLFVSGAEIGWDLDYTNKGRSFFRNTLGVSYGSDDAGTYNITGGSGIFSGVGAFSFGGVAPKLNTTFPPVGFAPYDVDYPDVLNPNGAGSATVLRYAGNASAAVRTVRGDSKIIVMGFPFECITNEGARNRLMGAVMADFVPDSGVEEWSLY